MCETKGYSDGTVWCMVCRKRINGYIYHVPGEALKRWDVTFPNAGYHYEQIGYKKRRVYTVCHECYDLYD